MGLRDLGRSLVAAALLLALAPGAFARDREDETEAPPAEAEKHAGAPGSFAKKPALGTWATCPVSGETFQVDASTHYSVWRGRTYAFCCPDCKGDFDKHPQKFAVPNHS